MFSGTNVGLQFLENGRCCTWCSKVPSVSPWQKDHWKHYGICHIHLKLFCLLCIKVYNLINSTIRCLLLEKIAESIYQVLQNHFKKQDIDINRITFLGKLAPYSWYFKRSFVYYLSHCCNDVLRYFYNKINIKNLYF